MKWEWITLLFIFKIIYALELPNDSWKQPRPSNVPINSNKSLNKVRHKTSRITNLITTSSSNSEGIHDVVEPYFPDVLYPTSILESAQPFYYSQTVNGEVLGPFSNDVKSSYKTLTAGKEKHLPNGVFIPKPIDNDEFNESLLSLDNKKQEGAVTNDTLFPIHNQGTSQTDYLEKLSIEATEVQTEDEKDEQSSEEIYENFSDYYDDSDENVSLETSQPIDIKYPTVFDTSMEVVDLYNETLAAIEEDFVREGSENIDITNDTTTFHVTPNYVVTSSTDNSHTDFVNDIMNIYTLIEETIRAISVVDFVISKTLSALGLEDKRNETTANDDEDFITNVTNYLYYDNITTLYDYYDCNVSDYLSTCNSIESDKTMTEEQEIESIYTHTSIIETDEYTEDLKTTCAYDFNKTIETQECTVIDESDSNII